MKASDCFRSICIEYRELFSSHEAMALALRIAPYEARYLMKGAIFPTLDVMIEIQAALRKVALAVERKKGNLVE